MRRDFLISLLGHLTVISVIILLNPVTGMFRSKPEVMMVNLAGVSMPAGASAVPEEGVPEEAEIKPKDNFKIANRDTVRAPKKEPPKKEEKEREKKTVAVKEKEKPTKKKKEGSGEAKADGKGGLDVSGKIGSGSGSGSGVGGLTVPYDIGLLVNRVERSWRNPVSSQQAITCTIYLQIDRQGNLLGSPSVERSSGISVFDQSAIFAIERAQPFPPFPSSFDYDYVGLHLDFEYEP
jgi:TonB family protein